MKKLVLLFLPAAALVFIGVATGLSEPLPGLGHGGRGEHGRGMRALGMLDLSDTQEEEIKSIRREAEKSTARKRADIHVAEVDLRALMDEDEPDRKKVHGQNSTSWRR